MWRPAQLAKVVVCFAIAISACLGATFEELAKAAAAARDADRVPEAIDLYKQALQMKADWAEGWFYVGTLYYDTDQYNDAQPAFAQYVKLEDKPAGWAFLGLCEFETGDYAQARAHLNQALKGGVAPEIEGVVRFHETLLLTRLGLFDQAMHGYRALVGRGVRDATLITALGLNALNRPILPRELPADQREFVNAVGQTAYMWLSGDRAKADAAFQTLVTAYPAAPGVHLLYATYLLSTHPEAAEQELRRELDVNPHSVEARAMLGLILIHADKAAEAKALARGAAEDGPSSPLAQYVYGLSLAETDPKEAAIHLEIAAQFDPSNFEYHIALAHVYSRSGRNGDARRERKISIELAKQSEARGPG